jgi:mannose-6-phosphate isomerase class I
MLSLQVHPGLSGTGPRKAESWIFLAAQTGASVVLGLRPGTTPGALARAVESGRPGPLLRKVDVSAGDILHVRPGTVHSLCGGVEVLEFQENCDITYRIWDWGRPGPGGLPRETHLALALDATDFSSETGSGQAGASCAGFGYRVCAVSGQAALSPFSLLFIPGGGGGGATSAACFAADGTGGSVDAGDGGWIAEPAGGEA